MSKVHFEDINDKNIKTKRYNANLGGDESYKPSPSDAQQMKLIIEQIQAVPVSTEQKYYMNKFFLNIAVKMSFNKKCHEICKFIIGKQVKLFDETGTFIVARPTFATVVEINYKIVTLIYISNSNTECTLYSTYYDYDYKHSYKYNYDHTTLKPEAEFNKKVSKIVKFDVLEILDDGGGSVQIVPDSEYQMHKIVVEHDVVEHDEGESYSVPKYTQDKMTESNTDSILFFDNDEDNAYDMKNTIEGCFSVLISDEKSETYKDSQQSNKDYMLTFTNTEDTWTNEYAHFMNSNYIYYSESMETFPICNGITQEHITSYVIPFMSNASTEPKTVIFDFDRTLTIMEMCLVPQTADHLQYFKQCIPNEVALFVFGGQERMNMLKPMYSSLKDANIKVFILTQNTRYLNPVSKPFLISIIKEIFKNFEEKDLICSNPLLSMSTAFNEHRDAMTVKNKPMGFIVEPPIVEQQLPLLDKLFRKTRKIEPSVSPEPQPSLWKKLTGSTSKIAPSKGGRKKSRRQKQRKTKNKKQNCKKIQRTFAKFRR